MKLHLGCGHKKLQRYLNCDISPEVEPDKVLDIEKKLPFNDSSVEEIIIEHCLEHIKGLQDVLKEFYRVCKKNALIKIKVPYFTHESAFSTMTHVRFFTYTTFDFLDPNHPCHYDAVGNFKTLHKRLNWRRPLKLFEFFNLFPRVYQELFCWVFPAKELEVVLKVIK